MTMDLRVYRERPAGKATAKSPAQALWHYLESQAQPRPPGKTRPGSNP